MISIRIVLFGQAVWALLLAYIRLRFTADSQLLVSFLADFWNAGRESPLEH
jgi:hypothetical protein